METLILDTEKKFRGKKKKIFLKCLKAHVWYERRKNAFLKRHFPVKISIFCNGDVPSFGNFSKYYKDQKDGDNCFCEHYLEGRLYSYNYVSRGHQHKCLMPDPETGK